MSCSQYCLGGGWDFAGVRYGESLQQDMVTIPIGPRQRFVVVTSPDFIQRHGRPASPRALAGMPCIGVRFPSGVRYRWEFVKDGEAMQAEVDGPLVLGEAPLIAFIDLVQAQPARSHHTSA